MIRYVLMLFVWLACAVGVNAQCANGRCAAPSVSSRTVVTSVSDPLAISWHPSQDPSVIGAWNGNTFLGRFDLDTGVWEPAIGKPVNLYGLSENRVDFSNRLVGQLKASCAATNCACDSCEGASCKCGPTIYGAIPVNYGSETKPRDNGPPINYSGGVDFSKLRGDRDHYQIGGREVSRAEGLGVLSGDHAAANVPNDSQYVRFTVIGGKAARDQVLEDLRTKPEFATFKDKFVIASYGADHWRIRDGGFKAPANPTGVMIYVQKADGTVLWRQDGYESPVKLVKALRDKVPGYDPAKDPSPDNQPLVAPIEPKAKSSWLAWLLGLIGVGGAGLYAIKKKGK